METLNLLDEKHTTNAFVYIKGNKLNIVSLYLEQEFGKHHTFKVLLDYDLIENSFLSEPLNQIEMIGKTLDIDLQQGNDSKGAYEFRGIIDDIYTEVREGKHGYLVIEGSSSTKLLERGKRLDIFTDMSLQQVFDEVTQGLSNNFLSKVNNPVYNIPVDFLMQYYESDWEFLQRLSAISGESLFYTGRDLVFGQYEDWPATELTYDRELIHIQFGSRLLANKFTNYQYLPCQDDTLRQESPARIENSNDYLDMAAQQSDDLITSRPVLLPSPLNVEDKGALDDIVKRQKIAAAGRTVYVKGITKTCAPRIGRLLTLAIPNKISKISNLGDYRVIKVSHMIDENHRYRCEFEAIPANLEFLPTPELKMPVASSLMGTVITNEDPEGLGRIRVEFPFAQDRHCAAWMRVMTPNAGSSEEVTKNRGMVFIPEKGDQVMVGFEFGDPNRPYVMGSMFHGKNGSGGGDNNATKSIITKSGITISFNDDASSLTLSDPSGNTIVMDGNKNITITAPETITINGKTLIVNTDEDITYNVNRSVISNITENYTQNVKNRELNVESNVTETIKGDLQTNVTNKISISADTGQLKTGGDYNIESGTIVTIKGSDEVKLT